MGGPPSYMVPFGKPGGYLFAGTLERNV